MPSKNLKILIEYFFVTFYLEEKDSSLSIDISFDIIICNIL